jgi:glycosyltransferase involved in cell wall biosynthesis
VTVSTGRAPARPAQRARTPRVRLLINVSFSHETQARAHFEPLLALEEVEEALLVADSPGPALEKLTTVVPPKLLMRLLGRAGAKLLVATWISARERPDWIVCYSLVPHGLNSWLMGRLTGRTRSIYHMIGGPCEWEGGGWTSDNRVVGSLRRPVFPLERFFLHVISSFDFVVTMGERGRRALIEHGLPPERAVAIPPSFDVERFRPSDGRRTYDLVTVGALIPRKRTADFLEAVARLRAERPALRASVVGSGPLDEELRALAASLGIADAVDFLGARPDVDRIYASSGVFVLPSRYEGLSVAQIEAMASGLPAVVSDVGEARDLLQDGHNGFLFPAGDVDALVERLAALLDDPELRERMGAAAARDARRHAGQERVTSLYARLLGRS